MRINRIKLILMIVALGQFISKAQGLELPLHLLQQPIDWESPVTSDAIQVLANKLIKDKSQATQLNNHLAWLSLSNQHDDVLKLIAAERNQSGVARSFEKLHLEMFSEASIIQHQQKTSFEQAFAQVFKKTSAAVTDKQLHQMGRHQGYSVKQGKASLDRLLDHLRKHSAEPSKDVFELIDEFQRFSVYAKIKTPMYTGFKAELAKRYIIDDKVLIKTKTGVTLSAVVVRKKGAKMLQPTALMSNIYTHELRNKWTAINAANHGYVGVVADTRGKRLSPDKIEPYEHDGKDTHEVIDWISRQSWSDGQVGMYGGSYSGFVQWAAARYQHPALKTIVPYVAAIPGQGLPMENNVFITANYAWPFYVTNNKFLDTDLYYDNQRWQQLNDKWYQSGRSYRAIDEVDGLPNPWLQKWLDHPAYDAYWQAMVPYQNEFKNINIPVLSVTGYYDDGQISAIHYLKEHEKYNPQLNHYLLIGPYDHFGAQGQPASHLRGYDIDPVAQIDIEAITFDWLNHVMKGGDKPALLKDKINYQLMGSNQWLHAPSLQQLNQNKQRFYLNNTKNGQYRVMSQSPAETHQAMEQSVDLLDRDASNNQYYPWPIIKAQLEVPNGLVFITDELKSDQQFSGTISGALTVKTNKKDFDFGLVLYELLPDGQAFHIGYHLGRASYAKDMSHRQLLEPNEIQTIPFERSRMTSKLIKRGSRIAVLLNVNKNAGAQVNYGTGKDVSEESIKDAGEPLKIDWYNNSYIDLPLKVWDTK